MYLIDTIRILIQEAIHKQHLLWGGGRGSKKLPILLSKKTTKGKEGVIYRKNGPTFSLMVLQFWGLANTN